MIDSNDKLGLTRPALRLSARDLSTAGVMIVVCISILAFYGPTDNWIWDPSYYYAQLQAPIINHSLDLRAITQPPNTFRTALGLQPSNWPIGPGLLWSPFFIAADVAVRWLGTPELATGLSWPYVAAVSAGSALYGLLGLIIIYRSCRLFTGRGPALVAAALALFATPLFFYIYRQPIMAHSTSILSSALLIYICIAIDQGAIELRYSGLLLGASVGLSAILRWIGISAAILPMVLFGWYLADALRAHDRGRIRTLLLQTLVAIITALAVVSPQLAFWHSVYGKWLVMPIQGFSQSRLPTYFLQLFIHTNRGIVWWAPAIVLGLVGLYHLRQPRLRAAFLVYLAGYLYVLGTWQIWHGGGGYGPRFFIELLPISTIGCALLVQTAWHGVGQKLAVGIAALLVLHQLVLVTMVEQGWLPLQAYWEGEPLGVSYQVDAAKHLLARPLDLFLTRPAVGADRQTALTSALNNARDLHTYLLPLVAALIIPAGIAVFLAFAARRRLALAAYMLLVLMLGWFGFLLTLAPL